MRTQSPQSEDAPLASLAELAEFSGELHRRASWFSAVASTGHRGGLSYGELLPLERRLEVVEQISRAIRILARHGQVFRQAEARALYAEGLTVAQLATVLGISRKRAAALVHGRAASG